ncbi:MAG: hypothetical protein LBE16_04765 [Clostridiales Family XIII bacterium]|jgi:hypothetical protein|nr:hypothetical protein [Clostridiales Family XIII bacterium]
MHKANSRSVLFLTELIIAILIFALSMGICGGVFASAFMTATAATNLNKAVFLSESAAEAFHAYDDRADFAAAIGGSLSDDGAGATVYYDENRQPQSGPDGAPYTLRVRFFEDGDLVSAEIEVLRNAQSVFELTAIKNTALTPGRSLR